MYTKKLFFFAMAFLGVSFTLFSAVRVVQAFGPLPFGGKVISSYTPGIACGGTGPVTITPVGFFPPTPYYIAPGTPAGYGKALPGDWILGLYSPTALPTCFTTSFPPLPFPALPVLLYGVSSIGF